MTITQSDATSNRLGSPPVVDPLNVHLRDGDRVFVTYWTTPDLTP
jgi:hypothetical protein